MKADFFHGERGLAEISFEEFNLLEGDRSFRFALEREANGGITPGSREQLVQKLREFFKGNLFRSRPEVICAIPLNGVTLRRITMPPADKNEFGQMLLLQIEKEFPIPPEELAWGAVETNASGEKAIFAVKKELLQPYRRIFEEVGCKVKFSVAAWARLGAVPRGNGNGNYWLIDLLSDRSEWVKVENGLPSQVRIISGKTEELSSALQRELSGRTGLVYLHGGTDEGKRLQDQVPQAVIEPLKATESKAANSLAISGLRELSAEKPLLILAEDHQAASPRSKNNIDWKWAIAAVLLALACLAVAQFKHSHQAKQLAKQYDAFKKYRATIPNLDRELAFLQFLKTNQPVYVDTFYALANASPPGLKLEGFNMNRRGELSFKGVLQNSEQVAEFRAKMLDSGAFSNVIIEEQTPTQDRQNLNVRISALWNGNAAPVAKGSTNKSKPSVPKVAMETRRTRP
jgi:type II secretory pathway component PulL